MAKRRLAATFQFLLGQDRSDLAAAEQALTAEFSEENWHRLQAAKAAIDERDREADDATAAGW